MNLQILSGRYVKITVNANSVNTFASVTEIDVGVHPLNLTILRDRRERTLNKVFDELSQAIIAVEMDSLIKRWKVRDSYFYANGFPGFRLGNPVLGLWSYCCCYPFILRQFLLT